MNIFKKLFGKKHRKNENTESECWYNNHHEKKRKIWNTPNEAATDGTAQFEMANTNQIAKRQH